MSRRGDNIRKRKDGRWEGRYTVITEIGVKKRYSVYGKTYGEVKSKLQQAKKDAGEKEKSRVKNERNITFSELADGWFQSLRNYKKESTIAKYQTIYEQYLHKQIGQTKVYSLLCNELCNEFSEKYFASLCANYSESVQKSIYCVFNQVMKYGAEQYHMPSIKYSRKSNKKNVSKIEVFSPEEQKKLLFFLHNHINIEKMGIVLCLSTGLRLGEVCALKWADIDFVSKTLHVNATVQRIANPDGETKTKLIETLPKTLCSVRDIPLADVTLELLMKFSNHGKYVLGGYKPMDPRTYQKIFKSFLTQSGIAPKKFHALRHTFATNCIEHGTDVKSLSEIMGHSNVQITLDRYVHPSISVKRQHMTNLASIYGQYWGQEATNY